MGLEVPLPSIKLSPVVWVRSPSLCASRPIFFYNFSQRADIAAWQFPSLGLSQGSLGRINDYLPIFAWFLLIQLASQQSDLVGIRRVPKHLFLKVHVLRGWNVKQNLQQGDAQGRLPQKVGA